MHRLLSMHVSLRNEHSKILSKLTKIQLSHYYVGNTPKFNYYLYIYNHAYTAHTHKRIRRRTHIRSHTKFALTHTGYIIRRQINRTR